MARNTTQMNHSYGGACLLSAPAQHACCAHLPPSFSTGPPPLSARLGLLPHLPLWVLQSPTPSRSRRWPTSAPCMHSTARSARWRRMQPAWTRPCGWAVGSVCFQLQSPSWMVRARQRSAADATVPIGHASSWRPAPPLPFPGRWASARASWAAWWLASQIVRPFVHTPWRCGMAPPASWRGSTRVGGGQYGGVAGSACVAVCLPAGLRSAGWRMLNALCCARHGLIGKANHGWSDHGVPRPN